MYYPGFCKYTFAQRRNRLTTHYSEHIPIAKRRIFVLKVSTSPQRVNELLCVEKCREITVCDDCSYRLPLGRLNSKEKKSIAMTKYVCYT